MNRREYEALVRHVWRDPRREQSLRIAIAFAIRPANWSKAYARDRIAEQFGVDVKTVCRAIKRFGPQMRGFLSWQAVAPYVSKAEAEDRVSRKRALYAELGGAFDGFAQFFELFGYDNLMVELPLSELFARLEAAELIRPMDKSPN